MLWLSAAHGLDLDTPERRAGFEQSLRAAVATIRDPDVRRHYESGGAGANRNFISGRVGPANSPAARPPCAILQRGRFAAAADRPVGKPPRQSDGAGRAGGERAKPRRGAAARDPHSSPGDRRGAAGIARPCPFCRQGICRAGGLAGVATWPNSQRFPPPSCGRRWQGRDMAKRLRRSWSGSGRPGLGGWPAAETGRAAAVFDDAAHLRLRTGALSIERQAAASAFARESNEVNLSRLRDIQEQDQRNLRPDQRDETEEAVIVHPFKRR